MNLWSCWIYKVCKMKVKKDILCLKVISITDMGRITLENNALNWHYLQKMCIELALPLLDFEKVMH